MAKPILIEDWEDLSKVPPSGTHRLYVEDGCRLKLSNAQITI